MLRTGLNNTGAKSLKASAGRVRTLATASSAVITPFTSMQSKLDHLIKNGQVPSSLTLAEKIVYGHITDPSTVDSPITRGETYLKLTPDRVAMQDASAQMAILQFMLAGKKTTSVPTSIHCDHLIQARQGAEKDLASALVTNKEIFDFLETAASKYGIAFWKPGSGIIHQIVLENYAAPGHLLLGTDSHTPNAGGLGTVAIGVGGADAVDGMAGIPWELKAPKVLGVHLTGKLNRWASPKDVILTLAGLLTVQGGTNYIIEYFGPGTETLSCTGMATICNMGAEVGATTSLFPYSASMRAYLNSTGRSPLAQAADEALHKGLLRADKAADYDRVIEIDLSKIEPHINGPFTPDAATPISKFAEVVKKNNWKDEISSSLIGSCTNSSYEDMTRVLSLVRQAQKKGLKAKTEFLVTPGSEQIRATMERDGIIKELEGANAQVLANACGPCIGQWKRKEEDTATENSIITSFNRNFKARNDGSVKTKNFLASPEIVTAMAFSGKLSFNPLKDKLKAIDGSEFLLEPPSGVSLPLSGFIPGRQDFSPPSKIEPNPSLQIDVSPSSQRLQLLAPFNAWDGKEFENMRLLVKVQGKCTTDHISAAGSWLKYKGHLENIANNTLIGATNAFNGKVNTVKNVITGQEGTIPDVARDYKKKGISWCVVTDWNYGEGSAREHAALQPRYLGGLAIIAKSFARIHETNLKKQGVVPLTFVNPDDYDRIPEDCTISKSGLSNVAPGSSVKLRVTPRDGSPFEIEVNHSLSYDQIGWIKAGSALNLIAQGGDV
ncbi:aconitate hydratase [Blyttiomyces sp. JEL0837]|nr:aconitate hydratase [Blyttiomyces sp. JEL0837]